MRIEGVGVGFALNIWKNIPRSKNSLENGGKFKWNWCEAIIYNYLLENGAYEYNEETEKVKVNFEKIGPVLKELATLVLMIQAEGDYQGAKDLIAKYVVNSPSMETLRNNLSEIPVDIKPIYEIEKMYK